MAVSRLVRQGNAGNFNANTVEFTGPASYTTGGVSFLPADVAMQSFDNVLIETDTVGIRAAYDYTNKKLLFYVSATGVQVANAFDLSAVKLRITCLGL